MAEEILLNGQPLKVAQIIDLTESKDVPSHKVEEGYDVSDHLINKPAEFQIQLEVEESDLEMIKQLYESKKPTEFVCKLGVFENIVVKEFHVTQGGSINTYKVTLSLKQILVAKSKMATVSLPQLKVTPDESQAPGGDTALHHHSLNKSLKLQNRLKKIKAGWIALLNFWVEYSVLERDNHANC